MRYYLPRRTVPLRQEFASGVCLNHVAGRQTRPVKITFGDVLSHYLTYSKMKTGEDKAQSSKNTDERNAGLPLRHWEGRVAKDLEPLEVQLWIDGLSQSKERSERSAGGATGQECPLPDSLQSL